MFHKKSNLLIIVLALLALSLVQTAFAQDNTAAPANTIELVGVIEAFDENTITVNGQVIDITGAEIKVVFEVDLPVKVEGVLAEDGTITALEVKPSEAGMMPGEIELVGLLTSLDGTTAVVSGISIDITSAEIYPGVEVDQVVKVHASLSESGTWVAREIELWETPANMPDDANSNDHVNEFELIGTLDELGDGFIVVSGMTIDITSAEIKDTLVTGMIVKVHVSIVDGMLVAREVETSHERERERERHEDDDDDGITLPPNCTPHQPNGWTAYVVQPGDTLPDLAAIIGASIEQLIKVNCLTDPANLVPGSIIYGPTYGQNTDDQNNNNHDDDDDDDDDHGSSNSNSGSDNRGSDDHGSDDHGSDDHGSDDHGSDNSGRGNSDDHDDDHNDDHDDDDDHGKGRDN